MSSIANALRHIKGNLTTKVTKEGHKREKVTKGTSWIRFASDERAGGLALPILQGQSRNSVKFLGIIRHQNQRTTPGLSGQENIIGANRLALGFQKGTDARGFLGRAEVKY